jgi:hypothetical protein
MKGDSHYTHRQADTQKTIKFNGQKVGILEDKKIQKKVKHPTMSLDRTPHLGARDPWRARAFAPRRDAEGVPCAAPGRG